MANIEMPQLGETVTEGTITRWFKTVGEAVAVDEVLFEVSTDKVDTEVPSPFGGTLSKIVVAEGETVDVGTVIAVVGDEPDGGGDSAPVEVSETVSEPEPVAEPPMTAPEPPKPAPANDAAPLSGGTSTPDAPSAATAGKLLSPVVRRLVTEYNIDPGQVSATGLGGRISRDDVQRYIDENKLVPGQTQPAPKQPAPTVSAVEEPVAADEPVVAHAVTAQSAAVAPLNSERETVIPLSNIRMRTAEHMVMSKAVSPHCLTAMEIDYEGVERVRKAHGAQFKESEGFSLTYLPFISRAAIDALREFPNINSSVGDGELIVHNYVNLGIAVDLDFEGLLAPVVHGADGMRMRNIARSVSDIAGRARQKKLSPDELSGGTFTITNAGSYGTMMQFPIINQPQVAILSTDSIKRKPVVITDDFGNESIAIHSMGVLAMAWDHRALDGAYAAAFMARMKEIIETRDWESELA